MQVARDEFGNLVFESTTTAIGEGKIIGVGTDAKLVFDGWPETGWRRSHGEQRGCSGE
jgi:hypothetical protein